MFITQSKTSLVGFALIGSMIFLPMSKHEEPAALDNDSLKTMLDNMGYSPSPLSKGYLIAIKQDTWTYNMQLVLSPNGTKLGINANLGKVDDPTAVTADQWRILLEKNGDIDPSAFYFDKDQGKLYLHRTLDNRDLTPAIIRDQVTNFCSNIHDTESVWAFTK
jgi:hypothetical protein